MKKGNLSPQTKKKRTLTLIKETTQSHILKHLQFG